MRILFIEDDAVLGEAVREHIASLGYGVDWLRSLADADAALSTVSYELVVLDLGLPDGKGLEFLRGLRKRGSTVPVVIATAMDQIAWRIEGLNSGADDYLVKPFDLSELTARIASVIRRYNGNPNPLFRIGELEVDVGQRFVSVAGRRVDLTAREWSILERLLRRSNAIVARSELEESLYGFGAEIDSNAVEVYVSRLRKKLGRDTIKTVRGAGYRIGSYGKS